MLKILAIIVSKLNKVNMTFRDYLSKTPNTLSNLPFGDITSSNNDISG